MEKKIETNTITKRRKQIRKLQNEVRTLREKNFNQADKITSLEQERSHFRNFVAGELKLNRYLKDTETLVAKESMTRIAVLLNKVSQFCVLN